MTEGSPFPQSRIVPPTLTEPYLVVSEKVGNDKFYFPVHRMWVDLETSAVMYPCKSDGEQFIKNALGPPVKMPVNYTIPADADASTSMKSEVDTRDEFGFKKCVLHKIHAQFSECYYVCNNNFISTARKNGPKSCVLRQKIRMTFGVIIHSESHSLVTATYVVLHRERE